MVGKDAGHQVRGEVFAFAVSHSPFPSGRQMGICIHAGRQRSLLHIFGWHMFHAYPSVTLRVGYANFHLRIRIFLEEVHVQSVGRPRKEEGISASTGSKQT